MKQRPWPFARHLAISLAQEAHVASTQARGSWGSQPLSKFRSFNMIADVFPQTTFPERVGRIGAIGGHGAVRQATTTSGCCHSQARCRRNEKRVSPGPCGA